jgi:hypothetical protein
MSLECPYPGIRNEPQERNPVFLIQHAYGQHLKGDHDGHNNLHQSSR